MALQFTFPALHGDNHSSASHSPSKKISALRVTRKAEGTPYLLGHTGAWCLYVGSDLAGVVFPPIPTSLAQVHPMLIVRQVRNPADRLASILLFEGRSPCSTGYFSEDEKTG